MTQTAKRYALLPLCLVTVAAVGACGAPSSDGEATSTTDSTTVTAAASDTATVTASGNPTDGATTVAAGTTPTAGATMTAAPSSTVAVPPPAATTATGAPSTVTVTVTATNGTAAPLPPGAGTTPTVTEPGTTPSSTPTSTPSASASLATVPASRLGNCHREKLTAYTMNLNGLNDKAKQTAQSVYRASRVCIKDNLVRLATRDSTRLSYQKADPKAVFALPQTDRRYDTVLKLMGLQSAVADVKGTNTYIWPRVIADPKDNSAWQEVVDLGLISSQESAKMRKAGGYYGPQLWIDANGKWRLYTL